jgi:glucose/mannose-6-phosphate isomerase
MTVNGGKNGHNYALVSQTIALYPDQFRQAWDEVEALKIPESYKNVTNIVFSGMGGSALGARVAVSYCYNKTRVPIDIYNEFHIPNYAGKNSLVVACSYSGNTEEIIETAHQALKQNAKLFIITVGGKLAEFAGKNNIPAYIFDPLNNPSKQPRMGIGYSISSFISLLNKLDIITISKDDVYSSLEKARKIAEVYNDEKHHQNLAKTFALRSKSKFPILVSSEHLTGIVHTIKNQINESSKTFCVAFNIPELNHHLMEGLSHPVKLRDTAIVLAFISKLYNAKTQKRYPVTLDIVDKHAIAHLQYHVGSEDKLTQIMETLIFGSYYSFYLAKLYNQDPMSVPWVDYFKKKLSG